MKQKLRIKDFDFKLVILVVATTILGILAIGSAKESVQSRQIMGMALGIAAMLIIAFTDYGMILKLYWPIYIVNIGLLLMVQFFQ